MLGPTVPIKDTGCLDWNTVSLNGTINEVLIKSTTRCHIRVNINVGLSGC